VQSLNNAITAARIATTNAMNVKVDISNATIGAVNAKTQLINATTIASQTKTEVIKATNDAKAYSKYTQ